MHSARIELTKLILAPIGTRITYQATGDTGIMYMLYAWYWYMLRYRCSNEWRRFHELEPSQLGAYHVPGTGTWYVYNVYSRRT